MEGFEAKCGSRFLFDGPVGLFDDIVEAFALPNFDVCARFIVVRYASGTAHLHFAMCALADGYLPPMKFATCFPRTSYQS